MICIFLNCIKHLISVEITKSMGSSVLLCSSIRSDSVERTHSRYVCPSLSFGIGIFQVRFLHFSSPMWLSMRIYVRFLHHSRIDKFAFRDTTSELSISWLNIIEVFKVIEGLLLMMMNLLERFFWQIAHFFLFHCCDQFFLKFLL